MSSQETPSLSIGWSQKEFMIIPFDHLKFTRTHYVDTQNND